MDDDPGRWRIHATFVSDQPGTDYLTVDAVVERDKAAETVRALLSLGVQIEVHTPTQIRVAGLVREVLLSDQSEDVTWAVTKRRVR